MGSPLTIICRECGREKLANEYKSGTKANGEKWSGTVCATCRKVYGRDIYKRNPDRTIDKRTMAQDIKDYLGFELAEDDVKEIMGGMGFDFDE